MNRFDAIFAGLLFAVFLGSVYPLMKENDSKTRLTSTRTIEFSSQSASAAKRIAAPLVKKNAIQSTLNSKYFLAPSATAKNLRAPIPPGPAVGVKSDVKLSEAQASMELRKEAMIEKLKELQYHQQREEEFLRQKLGFNEQQIEQVRIKTLNLQKELKLADLLARQKVREGAVYKKLAIDRHILWMSYAMGTENFQEYVNLRQP